MALIRILDARRLARLLLALLGFVVASPVFAAPQAARSLVGGPMTTASFERLTRLHVGATNDEMTALDRIHERYLERFRADIQPEIDALSKDRSGLRAGRKELDRQLRECERVSSKIAEADRALFDAASEALPEAKRAGMSKVRSARERQRLLQGVTAMVAGSSEGTVFVDIADLLSRDRFLRRVPAERREQFDAFISTQEARLLTQARSLAAAARESMARMSETNANYWTQTDALPQGATPEQMAQARAEAAKRLSERMQAYRLALKEAQKPYLKIARANHLENRTAMTQLEPIVGKAATDEFREFVALRALGGEAYRFGFGWGDTPQLSTIARRMERDPLIPESSRSRIAELLAGWFDARADALEALVAALDARDDDQQAADGAREDARMRAEAADDKLRDSLLAILGDGFGRYFDRVEPEPGEEGEVQFLVKIDELSPEAEAELGAEMGEGQGFEFGYIEPIKFVEVTSALRVVGLRFDGALANETYDAWLETKWKARVEPLNAAYVAAQDETYAFDESGEVRYNPAQYALMNDAARGLVAAVSDTEEALASDLAGALGLAPGSPGLTLVRLEGVRRFGDDMAGDSETNAHLPSPTRMLSLAGATPEEAERVLAESKEEWSRIIDALRPKLASIASIDERMGQLQVQSVTRDKIGAKSFTERLEALGKEREEILASMRGDVTKTFDDACRKAIVDPERLEEFRRARMRAVYPGLYSSELYAGQQLADALRLSGLDENLRADIDALRAEYIAVFDKLCDRMLEAERNANAVYESNFEEYSRLIDSIDPMRFERDERTSKARNELKRLLGPERARRVPGLLKSIRDAAESDEDGMDGGMDDDVEDETDAADEGGR